MISHFFWKSCGKPLDFQISRATSYKLGIGFRTAHEGVESGRSVEHQRLGSLWVSVCGDYSATRTKGSCLSARPRNIAVIPCTWSDPGSIGFHGLLTYLHQTRMATEIAQLNLISPQHPQTECHPSAHTESADS